MVRLGSWNQKVFRWTPLRQPNGTALTADTNVDCSRTRKYIGEKTGQGEVMSRYGALKAITIDAAWILG